MNQFFLCKNRIIFSQIFYYFYISSDGYGGIGKKVNGEYKIISSAGGKLLPIEGINLGGAANRLRVDCIGSTLTLSVNGIQVATATDSAIPGGNVGLIVRNYDTGGTDIIFNNFRVTKPSGSITH